MKNEQKKKKGFMAMLRESFGKSGGCCGGTGCCGPSDEGEKVEVNVTVSATWAAWAVLPSEAAEIPSSSNNTSAHPDCFLLKRMKCIRLRR